MRPNNRLDAFSVYLAQNNRRQSTVRRHLWNIKRFISKDRPLTKRRVDRFFLSLKEKGCKNTYLNSLTCTLRVYAQFRNLGDSLKKYPFFKEEPFVKATMSDDEIEAFLNLPRVGNECIKTYNQWTIFFSILAYTGMRPGEAAKLTVNDVDFGRDIFVLSGTKTNDFRLVPIPPNIGERLKKYLSGCDTILFPKRNGKPVHAADWYYHFQKRIRRLGIKRTNLTCYSLRHSLITRLLEEDVNLFKVQKLVGHRRLDTTARYTHLTIKDVQRAIRRHPLINRSEDPRAILKRVVETLNQFRLDDDPRFDLNVTQGGGKLEIKISVV